MNILLTILLVLAGTIALLLIFGLFMRKDYNIRREVTINAPRQNVFDYLRQLKNQDNFNKWVMVDPDMKREFKGTDGTVGFIYCWNGNKRAGEGEQEIKTIDEGKNIETEIRFVRPFPGIARANMVTESVTGNQTKVTWSNASTMKYPMNIMLPMIEKMLGKDMDTSLSTLKNILEK
ncbi:MAG: SRPBCC family protein [Chitinophagales bacterium]